MHVLHVIDSLGLGGAERMLVDIANATSAGGHRVSVCVTRSEAALASELREDIEVLVLARRRRMSFRAFAEIAAWVRRERVDILHVHMRSSLAFTLVLKSLFWLRTPIIFHDHFGSIEEDTSVPRWFRLGHPLISRYVGVSDALRTWACRAGVPEEKAVTIPNVLDLARLSQALPIDVRGTFGIPPGVLIGIVVASFKREKGIDLIIDAVERSRHRENVRILVAGGGVDSDFARECRARLESAGLANAILFVGPRNDIGNLLASVDFALLGSHSESGPLVLIEYLAKGLPVVSTKVGDIGRRLAAAGVPGFVAPRDANAFSVALDALLDLDVSARKARGEAGRRLLESGWDIRDMMPRWYAVYGQALARSGRVSRSQ